MKKLIVKIGAVIGGFFMLIAGILVVYFKGKSSGKEEEKNKQIKATVERTEDSRKLSDKVHNMTQKELYDDWQKDKRLQDKE